MEESLDKHMNGGERDGNSQRKMNIKTAKRKQRFQKDLYEASIEVCVCRGTWVA